MAEHLSVFMPDGVDRFDRRAASQASLSCLDAVGQLLVTGKLQRRGTLVTEKAVMRCLYDMDCAVANAGSYRACNPIFPMSKRSPCASAAKLAQTVRLQWMKSVDHWKSQADAPKDGWVCLWDVYGQHFGKRVGPTWADAASEIQKSDADNQGPINTGGIYIPQAAIDHRWHFGA